MAKFLPYKMNHKGKYIAKLLISEVFTQYGFPKNIVSNRDPKFTSKVWIEVFKTLGTKLNLSNGDHPQTNRKTERVNQVLEDMLRSHVTNK